MSECVMPVDDNSDHRGLFPSPPLHPHRPSLPFPFESIFLSLSHFFIVYASVGSPPLLNQSLIDPLSSEMKENNVVSLTGSKKGKKKGRKGKAKWEGFYLKYM